MNDEEYNALLSNLRESIPDFALFEAVHLNDFTLVELSVVLGVCTQTVHRRLRRVRERLRSHLPSDLLGDGGHTESKASYFG